VQLASHQSVPRSSGTIRTELLMNPESLIVPHDAAGIEDAVLNLLLNARDAVAGKKSGRVTVSFGTSGKGSARRAFVEIADNGAGIEPDRLEKIFVPFETTKEKGTGLGLTSVKRIVRAHGGEITVKSKPGKGSVFRIEIPAGE
jgi:signal transduction histidine kinase